MMRRELIECKSRATAKKQAPWAAVIAKVDGGYMAWESVADYQTWCAQK